MARKILVVEDDHNISDLIRMYLDKEGFEVQAVFDGGTAVETFRAWRIASHGRLGGLRENPGEQPDADYHDYGEKRGF